MSAEDGDNAEGNVAQKENNPVSPQVMQQMEDVFDRMKVLDYEKEFRAKKNNTRFHRAYFALPQGNASVQHKHFLEVVAWLMKLCNQDFNVDKYDDPNTSVNKMLLCLKALGLELDFPASKLKQGHGEAVCAVLNYLTEKALIDQGFTWNKPKYPTEEYAEEAKVDEEAEVEAEDEAIPIEEEEVIYGAVVPPPKPEVDLDDSQRHILVSQVDPIAWKTELERVGPRLKVSRVDDSRKEWRAHIEQTRLHEKAIQGNLPNISNQLQHIGTQTSEILERMTAKEKFINNQFEHLRQEYGELKSKQKAITERCKEASDKVSLMTNEYTQISEQLDEIKSHMDDRGNSMTDTSPLVKIKAALQTLKSEIKTFDLRIGVVSHTLMQSNIKHKKVFTKRSSDGGDPEFEFSDDDL